MIRRGLRLELVAGLGIALALPVLSLAAENAPHLATQTTLSVETRDQGGRTQAIVAVTVTGEDGLPATGAVAISDHGSQLAGAALNAQGHAGMVLNLLSGDHSLRAVYMGDATHLGSASQAAGVQAQDSSTPNFQISISPGTLTLTPGQTGTIMASVTPVNASALTAPMFVTLSCSGLPDQSSCTFTPENVEILPDAVDAIHQHDGRIITQQGVTSSAVHPRSNSSRLGASASRHARPGRTGLGSPPPPLAQPALAAGPAGPGLPCWAPRPASPATTTTTTARP